MKQNLAGIKRVVNSIKIKRRMLISYLLLILVSLTCVSLFTWNKVEGLISGYSRKVLLEAMDKTSDYLKYEIGGIINISNELVSHQRIREVLSADPSYYSFKRQYEAYREIEEFIERKINTTNIRNVRIYIRKGFFFSNQGVYFFRLDELENTIEYQRIHEKSGMLYVYSPAREAPGPQNDKLAFSRAIFNVAGNQLQGIISVEIRRKNIEETLGTANIFDMGGILLVDSEMEVAASVWKKAMWRIQPEIISKILSERERVLKTIHLGGQTFLAGYKSVGYYNWAVIPIISVEAINKKSREVMVQFLLFVLITGVVAFLMAYFSFISVVRRLERLKDKMNGVLQSQFERIEVDGRDEISELQESYNFMIQKFVTLLEENYKTGKKAKSYEIKTLQAQINPHFLYNTLDFIKWSAKKNDLNEISQFVVKLSKFYRLSLSGGRDLVTLSEEIQHASLYIDLINMRYKNIVNLTLKLPAEHLRYLVPRISLQPIVENAVMHGILEKSTGRGEITISSVVGDGTLEICVFDDGVGMKEDTLEKLRNRSLESSMFGGYGLRNTDERIRLEFGQDYGLTFESGPGEGTRVTLRLAAVLEEF